jgi:hypothetical protein
MDRRLIVRHPHGKDEPAGDAGSNRVGVLDAPVPPGRQLDLEARRPSGHEKPAGDDPRAPERHELAWLVRECEGVTSATCDALRKKRHQTALL